jgi:hypothetical protein
MDVDAYVAGTSLYRFSWDVKHFSTVTLHIFSLIEFIGSCRCEYCILNTTCNCSGRHPKGFKSSITLLNAWIMGLPDEELEVSREESIFMG